MPVYAILIHRKCFDINLFFSEFLGRTEICISSIMAEKKGSNGGPLTKKLTLLETESGMVTIRLDIQMF